MKTAHRDLTQNQTSQISIRLTEEGGYRLRLMQVEIPVEFQRGILKDGRSLKVVDAQGKETAVQTDFPEYWDDKTIKRAVLTFQATVDPYSTVLYRLLYGQGIRNNAQVENPVSIKEEGDRYITTMGPIAYYVRKKDFNLIDQAVFRGHSFLRQDVRGPIIRTKKGEELTPEGKAKFEILRNGPLRADLKIKGHYPNSRYSYEALIKFVSRKSWVEIIYHISSWEDVEALIVETPFSLGKNPVNCAFGARQEAQGRNLGWSVISSENTVDTTVGDFWLPQEGLVRFEVEPSGRQRVIFPPRTNGVEIWFHYLIGGPDDSVNTPAGAMVAKMKTVSENDIN